MVDLQELVNALQGTIHPDNGIRKAAEEALAEVPSIACRRWEGPMQSCRVFVPY